MLPGRSLLGRRRTCQIPWQVPAWELLRLFRTAQRESAEFFQASFVGVVPRKFHYQFMFRKSSHNLRLENLKSFVLNGEV